MTDLSFGGISIKHPDGRARANGAPSEVRLFAFTPSGLARDIPLSEKQLRKLVADGAKYLQILAGDRP